MKFGLVGFPLGQLGTHVDAEPHETVDRIATMADECGFAFLCAQDHVVAPRAWATERGGATWFDPMVLLSWCAAVTSRIALVTDVLVLPYRSPFAVAKFAATLDVMSRGRVILGVAAGYLEQEFDILGAEFAERGAWTDEAIQAIRHAWSNEWISFDGTYVSARDVTLSPRPAQAPPIWVGGNSWRALRRAVEHGDGWTPFLGSPTDIASMLSRARAELGLERAFDVAVPMRHGVYTPDHKRIDPDSVLRQTDSLAAAGVTHIKVGFRGPTLDGYLRALEEFAAGVIARA